MWDSFVEGITGLFQIGFYILMMLLVGGCFLYIIYAGIMKLAG